MSSKGFKRYELTDGTKLNYPDEGPRFETVRGESFRRLISEAQPT